MEKVASKLFLELAFLPNDGYGGEDLRYLEIYSLKSKTLNENFTNQKSLLSLGSGIRVGGTSTKISRGWQGVILRYPSY